MGNRDAERIIQAGAAASIVSAPFVVVPSTVLPCGTRVPAFAVARWLAARGPAGRVVLDPRAPPWVDVDYHAARAACAAAGYGLLTELQALAIAHDLTRQPVNWTGGAVGAGRLFQGLHRASVDGPQPACVDVDDPRERRWHVLSNGARLFDVAGNAFSWVFDDVQGGPDGVVAHAFAPSSPTVGTAPGMPLQRGLGWWPHAGRCWYGRALARGGSWSSQEGAGVFTVVDERPGRGRPYIGFRCTLPL
jgi:hypothetical protein